MIDKVLKVLGAIVLAEVILWLALYLYFVMGAFTIIRGMLQ